MPRQKEDGVKISDKYSPFFHSSFPPSLVKHSLLSSLANYNITYIFYQLKFPHHQKRQVRANALSYFLCHFLTCDGRFPAPARYTKMLQIF